MLKTLWIQDFKLREESYGFDNSGDINLGYDVTMWRSVGGKIHVHDVVAEYHPQHNFTHTNHSTTRQLQDLKVGPHSAALMSFCININPDACTVCTENINADLNNSTSVKIQRSSSISFIESNALGKNRTNLMKTI